jgi:hypothetical protein
MRERVRLVACCCLFTAAFAASANAQYRRYSPASSSETVVGENYHIELSGDLWSPTPTLTISSEALGIVGSQIDAVNDLGFSKTRFKELRLVLRPGKKHKFRFDYIPIDFSGDVTLKRELIFNGQRYKVNYPVQSAMEWKAYHLGYEYDFLYKPRWFVGVVLEAKYTDVNVSLNSPAANEYASVAAPIPAIGGIVRVYPIKSLAITGELNGFKLPANVDKEKRYDGKYVDFNVYATLNVARYFGAQVGYRSMDVMYKVKSDTGNFTLKGLYFGGVARF